MVFPILSTAWVGVPFTNFADILDGSQVRFNDDYGAMLVEADPSQITFQFITRQGVVVDTYTLEKSP
jgi:hypothetical protein